MNTIVAFSNIQRQQFPEDSDSHEGVGLSPDYNNSKKNLLENFDKILKETKYSFVVDWQIPKNSE